ncbi:hypothetical protein LG047_00410 [Methylocystis sp. WRRC1]|uniref:hypothetical protein n=1 Tax=Methylocystis sp. WRRC1 TaxID=1732014 RepID=UPI001D15AB65|nr:hypothetical protein [Methylocystis sp. WRRC1]MCC3243798.1 hypothetical protein [Methylocystis sp. WRRC1]
MTEDIAARIFADIYNEKAPMRERVARLIALLRSDEPLPPGTRKLLADLFDQDAKSSFRVDLKERRGKGEKKDQAQRIGRAVRDSNIANALIARISAGEPRKAVVDDLCKEFSVARSHVQKVAKTYERRFSSRPSK